MVRRGLEFRPLGPALWDDLEDLFGPRGACGGCWCMYWRLPRSEFVRRKGEGNRRRLREIVRSGEAPGILAYEDGRPVGWCAVAPREATPGLARSRVLKPVDGNPVWSITCLFVSRAHRRRGVSVRLIRAAADHALARGARIVEAYPVAPRKGRLPDPFVWTGLESAFRRAGFVEVLRRSPTRPIMRYPPA